MTTKREFITKVILTTLIVGAVVASVAIAPGLGPVLRLFDNKNQKRRVGFSRALKNLEKRKMVKIEEKKGNIVVTITDKGKERVLRYKFDDIKIEKQKKWDGLWRIIIFDIPTKNNYQRDLFRFKLKEIGFKMIQKSTFIYPYPAKNEVDFLGEYLGIRKYITYILAKEIDGGKNYRNIFKL